MERIAVQPREDHRAKLEEVGFSFHSWDNYWREDVCYRFSANEVDMIEGVTQELHNMCRSAVGHVIQENRFKELGIPELFWESIRKSWQRGDLSIYGRFDLCYDGKNPPKMLEYNADTPTSLLESAVAQWYWLGEVFPQYDQFNSVHERLVEQWKEAYKRGVRTLHLASVSDNEEDWVCTHYMMDCAVQAGLICKHLYVEDIGHQPADNRFVDMEGQDIDALFKLYPWEWMMQETFGPGVIDSSTKFFEPIWKSVLSNKALLPILWELFPEHPNLLAAHLEPTFMQDYAKKPFFSREGANIELHKNWDVVASDVGPYGREGYIYQDLCELPKFDDRYAVIGSWIIGDQAAGMCVREDKSLITTNQSNFVPHYFR